MQYLPRLARRSGPLAAIEKRPSQFPGFRLPRRVAENRGTAAPRKRDRTGRPGGQYAPKARRAERGIANLTRIIHHGDTENTEKTKARKQLHVKCSHSHEPQVAQ